ncbi:MAG: GAF domain-containing protein, partial [Armatimonadetes bacterium]|nr:GAF domain-containing protein [Armatimonadota bacterium]
MRSSESLDPAAQALCRELVEHYEAELSGFTAHLGQVYEELMLLYDVGSEVTATLDIEVIADLAVARVRELLEARDGAVVLAAGEAGPENLPVGSRQPDEAILPLLGWATALAVERDRSQIVNDLSDAGAPAAPVESLICSPLRVQGRTIGVLHVLDKAGTGGFSTEDQKLVEILASQVGVAIESSRLLHRAERHAA